MIVLPTPAQSLSAAQFGVLARVQLLRWMTEDQVDGLVRRAFLLPIERGVYRVAGGAVIPEQQAMAAVLRARPKARVTGPFVLGLFDVDGFTVADPFEILRQPNRRLRGVDFAHRVDPFPDEPRARFQGMPVVDVTTALLDTGSAVEELGGRRLRVAFDSARWRGLTSAERLAERACSLPSSHLGARFFQGLAADVGLESESEQERMLGSRLLRFRPRPEPQVWVTPRRRVDWFVRILRLALEYLGEVDHAHAEARLADRERDGELAAAGVRSVPIVAADLADETSFLAWIGHVFGARAYELGVEAPRLVG